ncbi:hypothetical protein [Paraburkholderia tropica]|uniref:hypothetical protein n=1 Tax=Paraburkholderia tropica TaxID=92647 RepID=UPI002AAFEBC8|nr:hypothetical protein [Paraburkholderia tropica]
MNHSAGVNEDGYEHVKNGDISGWPNATVMLRAGIIAGLTGAVCIWIYEALIWVGVQHLLPLGGIPRNATGLVFGKSVQENLGIGAYILGTVIHFAFASAWGVLFAIVWPYFQRRGYEATFIALFYAIVAWIAMHVAISIASDNHPNYYDPNVIIGGFMSHFCFTIPLAIVVKRKFSALAGR